jgi:hypothetical protein
VDVPRVVFVWALVFGRTPSVHGGSGSCSSANWPRLVGKGGRFAEWGVGFRVVPSEIGERLVLVRFGGVEKDRP